MRAPLLPQQSDGPSAGHLLGGRTHCGVGAKYRQQEDPFLPTGTAAVSLSVLHQPVPPHDLPVLEVEGPGALHGEEVPPQAALRDQVAALVSPKLGE